MLPRRELVVGASPGCHAHATRDGGASLRHHEDAYGRYALPMQDVAEGCHRDGALCADLKVNTYTEYRWCREDNGSDLSIGGRAPKQPHTAHLRVPGLPRDALQRFRLARPTGKNCPLRSSWPILGACMGLL